MLFVHDHRSSSCQLHNYASGVDSIIVFGMSFVGSVHLMDSDENRKKVVIQMVLSLPVKRS